MSIAAIKNSNSYSLSVVFDEDNRQNFFIDTGASKTIIQYEIMMHLLLNGILVEYIEDIKIPFSTASGQSPIGYLCRIRNVVIKGKNEGELALDYFYFYALTSKNEFISNQNPNEIVKLPNGLIGIDFLDCCSFEHSINGTIVFSDFDKQTYNENYSNIVCGKPSTLINSLQDLNNLFKVS